MAGDYRVKTKRDMNDSELLHAWAERRDEAAFAELVRRQLGLVHASARRQVGASPLADDVAQAVFLLLARKAGSLGSGVVLSGWLFRTTRFVAARALRAEQRRSHHESLATMQPATADAALAPEHWKEVEPHLDGAMASLSAADRDAVLLRYFEGKPLRVVGEQLGVNEEAAKKRVSRAVDKLREWLSSRGVVLTAAGFATVLANLPVGAAPSVLVAQIAGAATANTAGTTALSLAAGAARDWWLVQVRRLLPWAVTALLLLIISGGALVYLRAWPAPVAANVAQADVALGQAVVPEIASPAESIASPGTAAKLGPSKILLSLRSAADNRPLTGHVQVQIANKRTFLGSTDLETDSNGVIEIPVTVPDVNLVVVTVTVPKFVPKWIRWKRHEFVEPTLFYQCLLDPGAVVEGVVQDEAGNPVADAKIVPSASIYAPTSREDIAFDPRLTAVFSDAHGHFRSDQMPVPQDERSASLYITHPNFIRSRITLNGPKSLTTNHAVVLRRGEWITGRVEDSKHVPVSRAKIEEDGFAGLKANSGPDGAFKIGPFSKETVKLEVSAKGFRTTITSARVGTDTNELVIQLPFADVSGSASEPDLTRVVRLSGVVVDDESGEPVNTFEIHRRELDQRGEARDLLGQGHNGRFDWPVDMPLTNTLILEAAADGYENAASNLREINGTDQHYEFRMRRSVAITSRVVTLSGMSADGAALGLIGDSFGFQIMTDGTLSGWGTHQTNTDANGMFSLRSVPNAKSISIAHEAGFAEVTLPLTNRVPITLQPWGVVEGLVQTAGQPATNQKVSLTVWPREPGERPMRTLVMQTAVSDSRGRFRFDHVPPTLVALGRDYTISPGTSAIGPRQPVDVQPGTTNEVLFISSGRAVVGRFVLSQTVPDHDWRLDLQKLEQAFPELPPILGAGKDRDEMRRRIRAHSQRRMQMRAYYPDIRPDGSFRIDDVPTGDYVLKLRVSAPPKGDFMLQQMPESRAELGAMKIPVTVPAGDFNDPPLDLGTITIPVKKP